MNFKKTTIHNAGRLFTVFCAVCLLAALAGCTVRSAGTSTNENAAENRQYMAQLNQKTGELGEILEQFQAAVSANDAVGMQAAASSATKLVESIKELNPPESEEGVANLSEIKELYVEGLESMDAVLQDYSSLYTSVNAGSIDQASFNKQLKSVQDAYDKAVEKLAAADEALTELANE